MAGMRLSTLLSLITEDIRLVMAGKVQRSGKPGVYRVFKGDDGQINVEIFKNDAT